MSASAMLRSLLILISLCLLGLGLIAPEKVSAFEAKNTGPFQLLQEVVGQDWGSSQIADFGRDPRNVISLIDYLRSNITASGSRRVPDYDRLTDFGTWAYPDGNSCKNTRAYVLLRDADPNVKISYTNGSGCSILTGLWHDPYTGSDFKKARDLDIDHVVPLHNAWLSGAHKWKSPRRCHYANFMQNTIHLIPVSNSENRLKGDRGPDVYMPPNQGEKCAYLSKWMKIKTIWELSSTQSEVQAIEHLFVTNNCSAQDNLISAADLQQQRNLSEELIPACQDFHGQSFDPPTGRQANSNF